MKKKLYISPSLCVVHITVDGLMTTNSMFERPEENTDPMVKQEEDGITPGNALSRRRSVWDDEEDDDY